MLKKQYSFNPFIDVKMIFYFAIRKDRNDFNKIQFTFMITTVLISVPKVIFTEVGYRGYSLYKMASYIVQDFLIK